MGADLYAWLEYDAHEDPPFGRSDMDCECFALADWDDLSSNKDYRFMAAISGCRNELTVPPLFECRGVPPHPSREFRSHDDHLGAENPGWLYPYEVWAALDHHGIKIAELSLEVQVLLSAMQCLDWNLGSR